jgi:hypothetical protein
VGLGLALYVKLSICCCCLFVLPFYLITDRDCVAMPSIDVRTLTPPKDEVVVVRPLDRNSDARGQVLFDAAAPIRPPPPLPARDTWCPWNCPELGGGSRSHGDTWCPGAAPRREAGAGALATCSAPGVVLSREVGAGAAERRDAPGAALSREARAGAAGTRGAPGAALRREAGAGAQTTRGGLGAALS